MWDKEESYDFGYDDHINQRPFDPTGCLKAWYIKGWRQAKQDSILYGYEPEFLPCEQ